MSILELAAALLMLVLILALAAHAAVSFIKTKDEFDGVFCCLFVVLGFLVIDIINQGAGL